MSILRVITGPTSLERWLCWAGASLVKDASEPTPAYNLAGQLYFSPSGYILLSVPNALVRGVFAAMHEPGVELPPGHDGAPFSAHVTVMKPAEVEMLGGADRINERGKSFKYTIGRLVSADPDGWPGVSKVYFLTVHSTELQALRRSYGLSGLPHDGEHAFHVTVAIRKRGTLGTSSVSKAQPAASSS